MAIEELWSIFGDVFDITFPHTTILAIYASPFGGFHVRADDELLRIDSAMDEKALHYSKIGLIHRILDEDPQ